LIKARQSEEKESIMARKNKKAAIDAQAARRLKLLREGRGLSVRSLATLAGINPGTLSNIENAKTSPALSTLQSILQALGSSLGAFFSMQETTDGASYIFRANELIKISASSGVNIRGVPLKTGENNLQILHETYRSGAGTGRKPLRHKGHEGGLCLSGTMELTLDGERELLGPGDGFLYPSHLAHSWKNVGRGPAVLVTACTPPSF
jgi:transcriptional regulator with XRE-family HTH domain